MRDSGRYSSGKLSRSEWIQCRRNNAVRLVAKLRLHSPHEYESELAGDSGALRDSGFVAAL